MNPLLDEIPPSLIRSISERKRRGDIDLGLGEPTIRPDLAPFEAATEWTRRNGSPYSPNAGFLELRELIGRYVSSYAGAPSSADHVCVTIGSEEALYLAIKSVIDPARDEVLIVEPCYLAYPKICLLEGVQHRMVALDGDAGFRPSAEPILEAVAERTALIILNSPSNPTGRVWPAAELKALALGLERVGRSDILILADEVYRELYFTAEPPASIACFHERTLIASSLSKSSSLTGLRLGWLWGPPAVISAATKVHQFVNTAASTFSQRVALEIFRNPDSLGRFRADYQESRKVVLAAADAAEIDLLPPEGAFYGFIRLNERWRGDSLGAGETLLDEKRVVAVPGRAFGESGEGWLRISWVAPQDQLREGIARIGEFLSGS